MKSYQVGGSLNINASSYVIRPADSQLYEALVRGEFCYVFNCRQMGKSSLRVQTKNRLEQIGMSCVSVDMTNIGSQNISSLQWYKSIASELWRGFNLMKQVKFKQWWQDNSELAPVQQLNYFIIDVILPNVAAEQIFIFIDEIDSVLSLDFSTDDFFALIRHFYNARAETPELKRLCFALFGVATPCELIQDSQRTPFNIGRAIALGGLQLPEAMSLATGLEDFVSQPKELIKAIITWTGGQPFLTQKICHLVAQSRQSSTQAEIVQALDEDQYVWLEKLIQSNVLERWESQDEPEHLKTIRDRLLRDETKSGRLLIIYRQIYQQGSVLIDNSKEQIDLQLSGLVVKEDTTIVIRNPIYQAVFNLVWIDQQLNNLLSVLFKQDLV